MSKLIIYTSPLDTSVTLRHDSGWVIPANSDTDASGRQAKSFNIPNDTPNGWGARLTITAKGMVDLVQRGILFWEDTDWSFHADDFYLTAEKICPEPKPCPEVPPTNVIKPGDSPQVIIEKTYKNGKFNLATKEGCGKFTESCCVNLHEFNSTSWGHIKKSGAQNQYNGHAVDAVQILVQHLDTAAGIYDIVISSESPEAKPAFNFAGSPRPDLWYY